MSAQNDPVLSVAKYNARIGYLIADSMREKDPQGARQYRMDVLRAECEAEIAYCDRISRRANIQLYGSLLVIASVLVMAILHSGVI